MRDAMVRLGRVVHGSTCEAGDPPERQPPHVLLRASHTPRCQPTPAMRRNRPDTFFSPHSNRRAQVLTDSLDEFLSVDWFGGVVVASRV